MAHKLNPVETRNKWKQDPPTRWRKTWTLRPVAVVTRFRLTPAPCPPPQQAGLQGSGHLPKLRDLEGASITCLHSRATLLYDQDTPSTLWMEKWAPSSTLVPSPTLHGAPSFLL